MTHTGSHISLRNRMGGDGEISLCDQHGILVPSRF